MKKLFISGLPANTTDSSFESLFSTFGKVHSIKLVKDLFTGKCKGIGFVEMEGHEAREAMAGLNGKSVENSQLRVKYEVEKGKGRKGRRR